jgi:hypothetical protein
MDDLVRWLGAQLDGDEQIAREAAMAIGRTGYKDGMLVDPPARWGDELVADGQQWVARYHVVARKRLSAGEPGVTVAECAGFGGNPVAKHAAEHDPARVLREIDAKRQIIAEHELIPTGPGKAPGCEVCVSTPSWGPEVVSGPCTTLRLLASVYSDRDGYQESWRP